MAGMINTGQNYGQKALSGFIRQSAQQAQTDLANEQLKAAEEAQGQQMAVQGGVVGYQAAPTVAGMMAPEAASTSLTVGGTAVPVTSSVTGTGLTGASVLGGTGAAVPMGATVTPSLGTAALTTGTVGATTAAVPIATTAAAGAGGLAAGAETGATVGTTVGPVGTVAGAVVGAGLGYLLSKLF